MKTDAFREFKDDIRKAIAEVLAELKVESDIVLDRPPEGRGDLAFPCFPLSKKLRMAPDAMAKDISAKIKPVGMIEKVDSSGGYVNFHVSFEKLADSTIKEALSKKEKYGSGEPKKTRVLLEHTSVNPTGPIHVGRARNPIIGDTLARTMRQAGSDTTTEHYVNAGRPQGKLARESCEDGLEAIMAALKRINVVVDNFAWGSRFVEDGSVDKVIER